MPISDTRPEVDRLHIELLRRLTPAQRFQICQSLSRTAIELSRRAIRRRHPEMTEAEVGLMWVALNYGQEWADRIRAQREQRGNR